MSDTELRHKTEIRAATSEAADVRNRLNKELDELEAVLSRLRRVANEADGGDGGLNITVSTRDNSRHKSRWTLWKLR